MVRQTVHLLIVACLAAPPAFSLEIHFAGNASVATVLPPGTTAAWLWVDHRLGDYAPLITHGTEITPDADADGQVELEVPAGVSPLSVWVAVDLTTGLVATAAPEGFEPPAFSPPDAPELLAPSPSATRFQAPARIVRAVVSRPGVGAWQALAGDGTVLDADGEQDGVLTLDLAQLEPVGASPAAPESFAVGDTVVLIDVETLGLFQAVITAGPPEPGP
ncbi:MAG: hypothetical protein HC897_09505 [Thermoanaerobaculia bacterium]|nr:hypothetical protein [Thermoanaerobaculia bacterium]